MMTSKQAQAVGDSESRLGVGTRSRDSESGLGVGTRSRHSESQPGVGTLSGHSESQPRDEILFTIGQCSLGAVLVARSRGGLTAVLLGDDAEALRGELRRRIPSATLREAPEELRAFADEVIAFVESPARGLDLPLDLRGTEFQRSVWRALRDIPVGATASYGEIARRLGSPSAVRAVAAACAANPLAIVVPCHRVVARDGALTGYRWGIERKRALLEREGAVTESARGAD